MRNHPRRVKSIWGFKMIGTEAFQTREQALIEFGSCRACGRTVHEFPPGSPRRFDFVVVKWGADPNDPGLVCNPCIRLYKTPAPPFRFYS